MEKFNRTIRGYDPDEVNEFLDKVIGRVEAMVKEMKKKDETIASQKQKIDSFSTLSEENKTLKEKLAQYERMEGTLNRAIMIMRLAASKEGELLIEEAKKNANRIVNEALLRAEKTELEANVLRRNIGIFKRRIKDIVEAQLEVVEELEKVEL